MAFLRRWLLIWFTLVLGGGQVFAASAREDRAYAAAVTAFQDGMWSRAETEFAQFVQKYPKSDRLAEAVLMQAEAEFEQGKLPPAIALLTARKAGAGNLADQYVYWIGEAQYQGRDFPAAAETFVSLTRDFPGSSFRLRAVVEAAAAFAQQTNEWPQVVLLLEPTNSVFQRAAQMDPANELVSRGQLLLAQAKFAQKDFAGATTVLESLNPQTLKPQLDWQRAYLLHQVRLAAGDTNAALAVTTNLIQIALSEKNDVLQAEGLMLRARVLEQLGQKAEAIAACREILRLNAPAERARQAILKMAELAIAQNQFSDAEQSLEKFLTQFPGSAATDVALLTLGELQLKDYIAQLAPTNHLPAATNQLSAAQLRFDQFLHTFTNSPLAGKAYLDRGWCLWLAGKTNAPETLVAFRAAATNLPPSEDLAMARFKMGDALFAQKRFHQRVGQLPPGGGGIHRFSRRHANARRPRALPDGPREPGIDESGRREQRHGPAARSFIRPASMADSSILLVGEGLADARQPAAARAIFRKFEDMLPNSPLRPEAELAVARTYEQDQNPDWPAAIRQYENWRKDYPTNALRARVDYALASANFQAGNETNAFELFTNFVGQFPTNDAGAPGPILGGGPLLPPGRDELHGGGKKL